MKENLRATLWRLGLFLTLCFAGIFAIVAVFGQLRFESQHTYNAVFASVSGLREGNFVRIAGVEVGKVKKITVRDDATVNVEIAVEDSVVLTQGDRAVIRYLNLTGDRYLALVDGPGSARKLQPGHTIPLDRTQPALDLDALIGGFRPLFQALEPDQVNALTGQLIQAFQGQGDVISSFLSQTASLTGTLADRDKLIGEVIDNLNTVLTTLGDQSKELDEAVDSVEQLITGLADRSTDITTGIAYTDAAAAEITDFLGQARPPLHKVVNELDRVTGQAVDDREYLDNLLNTLPDKYQVLARQGLYGDFFSFYLCDAVLKLNGKGGQPVYVKVLGQSTGRCAPK
jgi:phospholipid/cholesterol/gamma-HCH transport system substrate-binding protein